MEGWVSGDFQNMREGSRAECQRVSSELPSREKTRISVPPCKRKTGRKIKDERDWALQGWWWDAGKERGAQVAGEVGVGLL